jgi:hypothetical protein
MSIIHINGQAVELGNEGSLSIRYHTHTEEQAAAALKAVRGLIANEDQDFEPSIRTSGQHVWLSQEITNSDGADIEWVIHLPKEVTDIDFDQSIYTKRAQEFVDRTLIEEDAEISLAHEEMDRERLDAAHFDLQDPDEREI